MTLKEKFNNLDNYVLIHNSRECEKIADEYAIEFAEWLKKEGYIIELIKCSRETNEILEIFKKEKGL